MTLYPDWEAISAIGQAVGAVGVILSLIYVGLQVRADARARRAATIHQLLQAFSDIQNSLAINRDMGDLLFRGLYGLETLEGSELPRFFAYFIGWFRIFEDGFYHHRDRHLDPGVWQGFEAQLCDLLTYPGVQAWWARRAHWFSPDFQSFIGAKLVESRAPRMYPEAEAERALSPAAATAASATAAGEAAAHSGG